MTGRLLRAIALLLLAAAAHAQEWPTATPESQGTDSAALARLVQYGANARMDSLLVLRNGRIVAEAYYAPYRADMLHRINSATKAVVGALTGIAIARGEFPAPGTPVLDLLPGAAPVDARWRSITVQHLLDMRSGIDWDETLTEAPPTSMMEMERSRDWERFVLGRGIARAPGEVFNYNSGASHLLAIALAKKVGVPLDRYARQHLFEPLGIAETRWRQDPQGFAIGGFGLYLHPRDMARFGQLYLQQGVWNGKQVLPREWAARAFSPKVPMSIPGYAYADFWWAIPKRDAYMAAGFNRQVIMVLPKLGIVAVTTGRWHWPFEDLITHLERAVTSDAALPENAAAQDELRSAVAQAATPKLLPPSAPAQLPFERAAWKLEDNRSGIAEIAVDLAASSYRVKLRSREYGGPIGFDGRYGEARDGEEPVFTTARWQGADTLQVEQRWPREAAVMNYTLRLVGEDVEFTSTNMFGVRAQVRGTRVR